MRNPCIGGKRTDGQCKMACADHQRRAGEPASGSCNDAVVAAMRVENVEFTARQQCPDRQHGRDVRAAFHPRVVDSETFSLGARAKAGADWADDLHGMATGAQYDHFLERSVLLPSPASGRLAM